MTTQEYLQSIDKRYRMENATEHTYRGDLQQLIEALVPGISATNEPKRQACGAPDYILTRKDIPVGYIEAKDIGDKDLDGMKKTGHKEQFDRYKHSLPNIIFTDYINFHLYHDGELVTRIAIGELTEKGIRPLAENIASFEDLIKEFCFRKTQTIKSSKRLAEMMAGKARLLSDIIEKALNSDADNSEDSSLRDQMTAFKNVLIHDITAKEFADVYAQTIAYGMFAARLHDPTLETFSRQEAAELIPRSNPFLRRLFGYIAGPDIDDRIRWVVDGLTDIFLACNVEELLRNYGKATRMEDPIIHFYETFLSEYDPKLRKSRGVWYTPQPVVNFIVRAVDDILKTEFGLPQGLADTSKTTIKTHIQGNNKQVEQEVHRVQILDPATGTGTFLAETIRQIYAKFEGQQGLWNDYVEKHLLPRINGFELLMASYAMAHLKLDLLLSQTGYKAKSSQRFRVYLTNSLEEHHPDTGTLFASWLSAEANEANRIKRDTPVMVVMGNPPYSVSSNNKSEWIEKLTADYKKELNERNIQPLSDDYIKFIRYGQYFIDKNGTGILAYISNNSFIDGIIHRQMRKNLLESFDSIYILDLHGNAKKKETCPDGSPDQNVFDIMQGVSINIFVKTGKRKKNELGKAFHYDLFGKREMKYEFLNKNSLKSTSWNILQTRKDNFFFIPKDYSEEGKYKKGFKIDELFSVNTSGIKTHNDKNLVSFSKFIDHNYKYHYRVFDDRYICYDLKQVLRNRFNVMKNIIIDNKNISLISTRQESTFNFQHVFISKLLIDINSISLQTKEISFTFPLYLYPDSDAQQSIEESTERRPNLNPEIVSKIAETIGLSFVPEKHSPPLEGWSKTGVASPPLEGCPQGGVAVSSPNCPQGGVVPHAKSPILTRINGVAIRRNFVEDLPYNPALKELAREKRKAGILSEVLFWQQVHKGEFYRIDFDRQRVIGNYIVDFYVKTLGLVVEIDGSSHDDKAGYDAQRQAYLESLGLKVFRAADGDVKKNMELVFQKLEKYIVQEYGIDPAEEATTPPCGHPSTGGETGTFAPIDLLDYIYGVLHSPTYREKYKEFLKIDFPRVPYPTIGTFWQLVRLGGELRQIHLLESPVVERYITQYPMAGSNTVEAIIYKEGKVYINADQYFDNVPAIAWEFFIGGYQPAQKWLKDRKGRTLGFEDILHYQKIIVALTETDRIMKEIDTIDI